jgi:hypothetical protein
VPFTRSAITFRPTAYGSSAPKRDASACPTTIGAGESTSTVVAASRLGSGLVVEAVHTDQSRWLPPT